ncbi:MAG: hypothetical protein R2911_28790 [Caldilineaceae bacterium]
MNYTVTVENRGPAATNVDWVIELGSAGIITNRACVAAGEPQFAR